MPCLYRAKCIVRLVCNQGYQFNVLFTWRILYIKMPKLHSVGLLLLQSMKWEKQCTYYLLLHYNNMFLLSCMQRNWQKKKTHRKSPFDWWDTNEIICGISTWKQKLAFEIFLDFSTFAILFIQNIPLYGYEYISLLLILMSNNNNTKVK